MLWQLPPARRAAHREPDEDDDRAAAWSQLQPPTTRVLITRQAVESPGSKVGLLPLGKHVRVETVLYGLLLPSGNDAAVALAQHVAGTVRRFVKEMNEEAARLGLGCTHYSSPSGYYDARNYSCAADLAELAHVDSQQPRIASDHAHRQRGAALPDQGRQAVPVQQQSAALYGYPGTTGLKTGYTEAGRQRAWWRPRSATGCAWGWCCCTRSNCPARQAAALLDAAFEHVYRQAPIPCLTRRCPPAV